MSNSQFRYKGALLALAVLCVGAFALPAQGASFDCAKAATKVEHIICDNPNISKLDDELSAAYVAVLRSNGGDLGAVKRSQRDWLQERDACANAACVKDAYDARLRALLSARPSGASTAQRPRFTVSQGEGRPFCDQYVRFLTGMAAKDMYPLCRPILGQGFPDLKEPSWDLMDISMNLPLVYQMERALAPSEHDRPVDTFDHWKTVFEREIAQGKAHPRLRRTHLALLEGGPIETVLSYEPDHEACAKEMKMYGYSSSPHRNLFLLDQKRNVIEPYISSMAFRGIPLDLLIYRGKPITFFVAWEVPSPAVRGELDTFQFKKVGAEPYTSVPLCKILFKVPGKIYERMSK